MSEIENQPEYLRLINSLIKAWNQQAQIQLKISAKHDEFGIDPSTFGFVSNMAQYRSLQPKFQNFNVEEINLSTLGQLFPEIFDSMILFFEESHSASKITFGSFSSHKHEIEKLNQEWQCCITKTNEIQANIFKLSPIEKAKIALPIAEQDFLIAQTSHLKYQFISDLMRQELEFEAQMMVDFLKRLQINSDLFFYISDSVVGLIKTHLKHNPISTELKLEIESLCQKFMSYNSSYCRKYIAQLRKLVPATQIENPITPGEPWADKAIESIDALNGKAKDSWLSLLTQCSLTLESKPSGKWLKTMNSHLQSIGTENFKQSILSWFPLVDKPRTIPKINHYLGEVDLINEINGDILKGLVWLCADMDDVEIARALSRLAISTYRKIPQVGARCAKVGNACIWALSQMPTPEAIAQLALLKVKIKFNNAQKSIEKAFEQAAKKAGIPREDIEEMSVPAYGLAEVGLMRETLGDFTVELEVTGTNKTAIRWYKADGKLQKSIPQAIKDNFAEELKELKQSEKDIQKMLPAQRDRLESLYRIEKTWKFATWKERYLDHPLIGYLARRILWQFTSGENHAVGIWYEGLCDRATQPISWIDEDTEVSLWHPISATPEVISEWRNWLIEKEIQQPFKQAFRELYLLTPAEENTNTYSNRFAAHILKQHQFNALCLARGWKNALRLMVDSGFSAPSLSLPHWQLRAEYWVDGIGDNYGTDTNDTGTYLYLTTDQVRFYSINTTENYSYGYGGGYETHGVNEPIPLSQIPALVFTEVMRDVDLFVGVGSVGNDPNWINGNLENNQRNYWQEYSFGELSATAQTRKQVLENLIPRLKKIRDRCSFKDKFLIVKGDIRTYKIHLGSGNILMEPNDTYLCIVKAQEYNTEQVFLPFEGDKTLAVILSKAFLLAEDTKITDRTILSQIR
jgi:hypothetical protein